MQLTIVSVITTLFTLSLDTNKPLAFVCVVTALALVASFLTKRYRIKPDDE
jgi:hypothetical protein